MDSTLLEENDKLREEKKGKCNGKVKEWECDKQFSEVTIPKMSAVCVFKTKYGNVLQSAENVPLMCDYWTLRATDSCLARNKRLMIP